MGSASITTHFRPPGSLRQGLGHPKDIVPKGKKTNVVYRAVCCVCGDDYVGETKQPLVKRVHQHTHPAAGRPNSAVLDHMGDTGHRVDLVLRYLKGKKTGEGEGLGRQSGSDS